MSKILELFSVTVMIVLTHYVNYLTCVYFSLIGKEEEKLVNEYNVVRKKQAVSRHGGAHL